MPLLSVFFAFDFVLFVEGHPKQRRTVVGQAFLFTPLAISFIVAGVRNVAMTL